MIPQDVIDQVLESTDIVQLVEEYVQLTKRSASNSFGLCPFHSEKTPSFSVSSSKQMFYCFGCHKGGNAIKFISEIEGLNYPEAIRFLAKRAGIPLPEYKDDQYQKNELQRKRQLVIALKAAQYFYRNWCSDQGYVGRNYLQKRGFTDKMLKHFGVGYAGSSWDALYRHLQNQGFIDEEILQSGLCKRSAKGKIFDLFRERVMFPIFTAFDDVIAFGGRLTVAGEPKYLNSPETPIYHKGKQLFALNFARKSDEKGFLITEGYLDVMSLHQAGFDNAVAGLGTALTNQQARLLKRFRSDVVLCYDADNAGQKATLKALDICANEGLNVKVMQIPNGLDPDEFIQQLGAERFRELIKTALSELDYRFWVAEQGAKSEAGFDLLQYQENCCALLSKIDSVVTREIYADKVAQKLRVPKDTVLREAERLQSDVAPTSQDLQTARFGASSSARLHQKATEPKQGVEQNRTLPGFLLSSEESVLLVMLANEPDLYGKMQIKPTLQDFAHDIPRDFLGYILEQVQSNKLTLAKLLNYSSLTTDEQEAVSKALIEANLQYEQARGEHLSKVADNLLLRIRQASRKKEKSYLLAKLKQLKPNQVAEKEQIITRLNELNKL